MTAQGFTQADVARLVAPRWAAISPKDGCSPASAASRLNRWLKGAPMRDDALAELLAVLRIGVHGPSSDPET
jgi:hypothetical protein